VLREPQSAEKGKEVIVPGETMVIIALDPVTIHLIRREAATKIRHLLEQLNIMLTGKSMGCNKARQSTADDAYPHSSNL
jgi:hypothetical protein